MYRLYYRDARGNRLVVEHVKNLGALSRKLTKRGATCLVARREVVPS